MKQLTDIPEEVFDYIFKNLSLKDLLRLRKVSRFTKSLADNYIQVHVKETGGIRKLYLDPVANGSSYHHSVSRYVNHLKSGCLCVPPSGLNLVFKDDKCFENQPMKSLGQLCSVSITRLHLDLLKMNPMINKSLAAFLEPLQNLTHLTIGCFLVENIDDHGTMNADAEEGNKITLLRSFKKLKSLTIMSYQEPFSGTATYFIWQFLEDCFQTLEYLAYPPLIPYTMPSLLFSYNQEAVQCIIRLIEKRAQQFPDKQNLQSFDLGRCQEPYWGRGYDDFFNLFRCCALHNVKILNFSSDFLKGRGRPFANFVSTSVTSMWGLTGSMFLLHLPILEKLTIQVRNFSFPPNPIVSQKWINVKELNLTVYSQPIKITKVASQRLLDFFFTGETRAEMKKLELDFIMSRRGGDSIAYPFPASIVSTCPNLKVLRLENWPDVRNLDITVLWTGLPLLETLSLINCASMDYASFVGEDVSQPAFLQLKNLKKFELGQLASMPRITDALFRDVFRHMPLQEFKLWSRSSLTIGPGIVKGVTLEGILSLLTGEFAKTIEKFQLRNGLILDNVSRAQLIATESKFRSYHL